METVGIKCTKGNMRACSSAGRAPDLHSGGHRFDPVQVHLTNETVQYILQKLLIT